MANNIVRFLPKKAGSSSTQGDDGWDSRLEPSAPMTHRTANKELIYEDWCGRPSLFFIASHSAIYPRHWHKSPICSCPFQSQHIYSPCGIPCQKERPLLKALKHQSDHCSASSRPCRRARYIMFTLENPQRTRPPAAILLLLAPHPRPHHLQLGRPKEPCQPRS